MRNGHKRLWVCTITMLSLSLSGDLVSVARADSLTACLTQGGKFKQIEQGDNPLKTCKRNRQVVVLPLAEKVDQVSDRVAELSSKTHEVPFHALIRNGEEAILAVAQGMELVAQATANPMPMAQLSQSPVMAAEVQLARRYTLSLFLVNTSLSTSVQYVGSGGTVEPLGKVVLVQWTDVQETIVVGHDEVNTITAFNNDGSHLQLDVSKMMAVANLAEDHVILVGEAKMIDRATFEIGSSPTP